MLDCLFFRDGRTYQTDVMKGKAFYDGILKKRYFTFGPCDFLAAYFVYSTIYYVTTQPYNSLSDVYTAVYKLTETIMYLMTKTVI